MIQLITTTPAPRRLKPTSLSFNILASLFTRSWAWSSSPLPRGHECITFRRENSSFTMQIVSFTVRNQNYYMNLYNESYFRKMWDQKNPTISVSGKKHIKWLVQFTNQGLNHHKKMNTDIDYIASVSAQGLYILKRLIMLHGCYLQDTDMGWWISANIGCSESFFLLRKTHTLVEFVTLTEASQCLPVSKSLFP